MPSKAKALSSIQTLSSSSSTSLLSEDPPPTALDTHPAELESRTLHSPKPLEGLNGNTKHDSTGSLTMGKKPTRNLIRFQRRKMECGELGGTKKGRLKVSCGCRGEGLDWDNRGSGQTGGGEGVREQHAKNIPDTG